ncbi:MAG TPA: hypothetical protein VKF42_05435 [Chitinivibrionales bacterium]|nr:hypothetical protein [Chitinivibrionales bacterium]
MQKVLVMAAVLFSLIGCSNNNKITIVNDAQAPIYFNFRANETTVASGASMTIKNIPNGTYSYNTSFELPDNQVTSTTISGNAGAGSLRFSQENTNQLLIFSSTYLTGVYTVYLNATSTDSSGATSILLGP